LIEIYHFSDDPDIEIFTPRPVRVAVDRGADREWLNGPLVWATDAAHSLLYLFPRECPRVVIWPTPDTNAEDRERWFGASSSRAIAFVEEAWLERLRIAVVHRYHLPADSFEDVEDVGMWVSRTPVRPLRVESLRELPRQMEDQNIALRALPRLTPLKVLWRTSVHASGVRMRNAQGWGKPGWTHSKPGRTVHVPDDDP
jgi:hypothetical protein